MKSLLLDTSEEARILIDELEFESAHERVLALREKLQRALEQDRVWRAELRSEIEREVRGEHLAPPPVPHRDDWHLAPIFDAWPDFDLYEPNEEDTESGLVPKFERVHHYLQSRAAVTGESYTDTVDGLVMSFLRYGERTIHGVWVDEDGKMIVDFKEPHPDFFKKWHESNTVDALAAANVRDHAQSLVKIAKYVSDAPSTMSEFIAALAAHVPNRAAPPTLRDAAARIALRVVDRAEQFDLTIEELLAQSNVADELQHAGGDV